MIEHILKILIILVIYVSGCKHRNIYCNQRKNISLLTNASVTWPYNTLKNFQFNTIYFPPTVYSESNKVNHDFNRIMLISRCQTYPQSDSTTLFPTGFHVESPAVLSIAWISNKVNHGLKLKVFMGSICYLCYKKWKYGCYLKT